VRNPWISLDKDNEPRRGRQTCYNLRRSNNPNAAPLTRRVKPGPVSQLERRIEQVKLLPRKKQQLVIEFLDAIISTEKV
jgi:hypothetical protein